MENFTIKDLQNFEWENGRPHPYIVHLVDWFGGVDGVEREIFIVMQRCDCGLDDLLCGVRECRSLYEKEIDKKKPKKNKKIL